MTCKKTKKIQAIFLPYQKAWIEDSSPIKIMEKSRQIGITWATAYGAIRRQITQKNRLDTFVSTRDYALSKLFLQDCKAFGNILNSASQKCYHKAILDKKQTSNLSLSFSNGTKIHALSSSPNAQAGKRGSRVLDEFALHQDPQMLYSIAYPGTTWGGQIEIISTHRGANNYFNQLVQEVKSNKPKNISLHKVTLEDALNQGFLSYLKAKLPEDDPRQAMDESSYFNYIKDSCPSPNAFYQEYMCKPEDESSCFIPYSLLTQNEYMSEDSWEASLPLPKNKNFYLGIDIARVQDLSVFYLIEHISPIFFTRKIIKYKNTPFSQQARMLQDLLQSPSLRRVCIDQSGIGRQFTESFLEQYGPGRIEGINFTSQNKELLAYYLRLNLENKAFKIPNCEFLRADFHSIQKTTTSLGNTRFDAKPHKTQGHADQFWAASLALHACQTTPIKQKSHYTSISKKESRSLI